MFTNCLHFIHTEFTLPPYNVLVQLRKYKKLERWCLVTKVKIAYRTFVRSEYRPERVFKLLKNTR